MKKKILVLGIVIILNFSAFFVLAIGNRESVIDGGSISGYVRQVNGNPIVGALVEVIRQDEGGWWGIYSGSDGRYSVDDLPIGDYKIRAFKSGYAREYYNNVFYSGEADIIHINESSEIIGINFDLTLGGAISGFVFDKNDGNPINGADVYVNPSNYFFDDGFHTVTDTNGNYIVDGLALGFYKVQSQSIGYAITQYYDGVYGWNNADNVKVTPPNITSDINISLVLAGSISGFIFESDGITPIENVVLIADTIGGGFQGIGNNSKKDGGFWIEGLPPGNYTLRTGDSDYPGWYAGEFYDSKLTGNTADVITVAAGFDTPNINFTLDEGGWVTGRVFDEETGESISGFQLGACLPNGEGVTPAPRVSYDGSFKFGLREGNYFIQVLDPPGYVIEWYNDSYDMATATLVNVTLHHETSGIDFYLSKTGSITGIIVDKNGNPINGASVYAYSTIYPGNGAFSREDGSYEIEGLPSDEYLVQVSVSGYNSEYYDNVSDPNDATLVTVNAPDETKNIDFILTQGIGVYISRPEIGALYVFDKEILSLPFTYPIIVGKINVKAVAFGSDKVEFYVDEELKYTDSESPFSWLWDETSFGRHILKVVVYEMVDVVSDEIRVWKFS